MNAKTRSLNIDALKGLAIIAVVLYHASDKLMPSGYLGVDVFLVIAGYFMMVSMLKQPKFHPVKFITDRLFRLWPLVLVVSITAMLVGYFTMLPDDFKNLNESVVASNWFANNILAFLTTKNYWDVVNEYKPLMHTWYCGVLMQGYILCSIIIVLAQRLTSGRRRILAVFLGVAWLVSFVLYLLPCFSLYLKFYIPFFRLFEILSGALVALFCRQNDDEIAPGRFGWVYLAVGVLCTLAVFCLLFCFRFVRGVETPVVATVAATSVLLYVMRKRDIPAFFGTKILAYLGCGCFSIYIWHQLLLAYGRYCIFAEWNKYAIAAFAVGLIVISIPSYLFVEKKFCTGLVKSGHRNIWLCALVMIGMVSSGAALYFYRIAGCVRDVPEMELYVKNRVRDLHANYNSRAYKLDREFAGGKKKILVVGHSYARDWCNVLAESKFANKIEVSYIYHPNQERVDRSRQRFFDADYIFYVEETFPAMLPSGINKDKLYMVGEKYFGVSNGLIYQRRFSANYKNSSVRVPDAVMEKNNLLRSQLKDHYIDMFLPVQNEDGSVRVFTPEGKFISQDCRHLTQSGARYYAKKFEPFLEKLLLP